MNIVTPILGLMPLNPDSWLRSCSFAQPPPQTQEAMGSWEPHPHNHTRSRRPGVPDPWGEEGAEGNRCVFSVQLPDTRCRIFELRDQTAAGGLPPNPQGALTQAKSACQQILSAPQPGSSKGPADRSGGQLCWRAEQGNRYSQHIHTLSLSLSVHKYGSLDTQAATHRPQSRKGLVSGTRVHSPH